jgi:hypothetical protein
MSTVAHCSWNNGRARLTSCPLIVSKRFPLLQWLAIPTLLVLVVTAVNVVRVQDFQLLIRTNPSRLKETRTDSAIATAAATTTTAAGTLASTVVTDESLSPPSQQPPRIVWLLSFPNSGTTYTLRYIQGRTQTTTATNYGASEQVGYNTSIPVDSNVPEGPFFRHPHWPVPKHSILTKTHCEAHRVRVPLDDFITACRTGQASLQNGSHVHVQTTRYPLPAAAVHLIRHPVDNIVARMHYHQKQRAAKELPTQDRSTPTSTTTTKEDWKAYCDYIDNSTLQRYQKTLRKEQDFWNRYLRPVPCALEFYRYFQWHGHAHAMVSSLSLTPLYMVVYYENYTSHFDDAVRELLEFLHWNATAILSSQQQTSDNVVSTWAWPPAVVRLDLLDDDPIPPAPPEFVPGKTYPDVLTRSQMAAVQRLGRAMIPNNATWALLSHYFT